MFHDELLDLFGAMRHTGSSLDYKINPYEDDADSANFGSVADLFNFILEESSVKKLAVISSQPQHCEEAPQVEGMKTVFEVREYRVIPANQPRPKAIEKGSEDEEFIIACNNTNLTINPHKLGFTPKHFWPDRDQTLGNIHEDFFKRKNHQCCRFRHKLFNAIKLGEACPHLGKFVGIEWVSSNILRIDKHRFRRLLGINSLFHRQGNFRLMPSSILQLRWFASSMDRML